MPFEITQQKLRELLDYDPTTGIFRWKVTLSCRRVAGMTAGCLHKQLGCIYIGIGGRIHKAHRLAWLYVYGSWPKTGLDHIDGDHANNRIANLREANQTQNMQNLWRAHRDNKFGLLGVRKSGKRFYAAIKVGQILANSFKYDTPEEAHAAYLEMKSVLHPFGAIAAK